MRGDKREKKSNENRKLSFVAQDFLKQFNLLSILRIISYSSADYRSSRNISCCLP